MATETQNAVDQETFIQLIEDVGIELKSLKVSKSQSRETLAFTAKIYLNGSVAGEARNDGNGGCTMISRTYDGRSDSFKGQLDELEEIADSLPAVESGFEGMGPLDTTLEMAISWLASHEDMLKDIKQQIKRNDALVVQTTDQEYGEYLILSNSVRNGEVDEGAYAYLETEGYEIEVDYNELLS